MFDLIVYNQIFIVWPYLQSKQREKSHITFMELSYIPFALTSTNSIARTSHTSRLSVIA